MHATIIQAVGAERIREFHEQAARDRLLSEARRARRARHAELARPRTGPRWPSRRVTAPAAALDEPQAHDRQPVGSRAA